MKTYFFLIIYIVVGICVVALINILLTNYVLIPDPCYYHTNEMDRFMSVFFNLPASEGFHPVPSLINIVLTLSIGMVLGFITWNKINRKNVTQQHV